MSNHQDSFYRDLSAGKVVEQKVLEIVKTKYPEAHIVDGYCKDWDIYIPEIGKGIEVKSDQKSQHTGNIVVEIEFHGKPSALSTTKAYRWFFYTGNEIIITSPARLRNMIQDYKLYPATFTGKGDKHAKKAYLVKQHLIEKTAIKIIPDD